MANRTLFFKPDRDSMNKISLDTQVHGTESMAKRASFVRPDRRLMIKISLETQVH